jgi:uncharacterized DUF497 family protein
MRFEWDNAKAATNLAKHGVSFSAACAAFRDPNYVVLFDPQHSDAEIRWFILGRVKGRILTVRYTHRGDRIRIIGAGYWTAYEIVYEKENRN